ncbi:YaaC family protein [Bradyrhizobium elkanii]
MSSGNWTKLKFLESITNLKAVIGQSAGRAPSTEIARDIGACLQQGRLFFEIASSAPLQVRPLQLYYGIVGFAKAIVLARKVQSIATIAQSHGLSDVSQQRTKIEELALQFQQRGVFQQFNDVVAPLGRLSFYSGYMRQFEQKPFHDAAGLNGVTCSLKDILARIPGLQKLYRRTFSEDGACWSVSFHHTGDRVELRIDDPHLFADRDDLQSRVEKWRLDFPWLNDWCFTEGVHAWDNSVLLFFNKLKPSAGEFSDQVLKPTDIGFASEKTNESFIPFAAILPALAGGLTNDHPTAIKPLNGVALSEFSLQFCGTFLLSSLVRYRPQIWQHALSHSIAQDMPVDDRALSLIELFLQTVLETFPKLVEYCIDPAGTD